MRVYIALVLLCAACTAHADPVTITAVVMTNAGGWATVMGYALLIGSAVLTADAARSQAEAKRREALRARNDAMQDRNATRVATDAPHRTVYGRARVGSDIVAIFSSGARDEFKHLVCVHAAHECDGIEEVYVAGKALGALDANGDVTTGDYLSLSTISVDGETHTGASFNLAHTPVAGSVRVSYDDGTGNGAQSAGFTHTGAAVTVTAPSGYTWYCHYDYQIGTSRVRVKKHLGTPADTADASLLSEVPTKWTSTAVLRGFCYTVVRLDLNQAEFQGGVPPVEVLLRGKKLYDPRDASTIWGQNPALAIHDYLTGPMCGVDAADLPAADFIAAANVCDEDIGGGTKRYTCNGDVKSGQDPRRTLESLAGCMAGHVVGTTWQVAAGKYVAPVMALDQSDIVGALSVIGGAPDADLSNGVRGQYIGAENGYVLTDFKPFQNAAYLAADRRELWSDINFPFTDSVQRAHNLARIYTEDQRNGFTLIGTFSLKTWALKVGQRVAFTSALLGQSAKIYRLTNKRYGPDQAVELTLKEDAASIWDLADAVAADSTPNTNLPNPWAVGLCGNVQMAESLYETTGSAGVKAKATLSWDAPQNSTILDYEVEYKKYTSGAWQELINVSATHYDFLDIAPGTYDFRVKARNIMGAIGEYTAIKTFVVYGLTTVPGNVAGFHCVSFGGLVLATWTQTADLDVKIGGKVQIRWSPLASGATFSAGVVVQEIPGDAVNAFLPLATGTYMAKFVDSTNNFSAAEAAFAVTESLVTGWTTVATSAQHPGYAGTKTNCVLSGNNLIFTGASLTASYAYAATIDCGSVAVRRYHSHIKANAYVASDLISARGLVSTWASISSAIVNGCNAYQEIRVSDDNAAWSAWTKFAVADLKGRYAQVRLQMTRDTGANNIEIIELQTTAKVTP